MTGGGSPVGDQGLQGEPRSCKAPGRPTQARETPNQQRTLREAFQNNGDRGSIPAVLGPYTLWFATREASVTVP